MELFESLPPLSPVQFFGVTANCFYTEGHVGKKAKWLLPDMTDLLEEESFAEIYAGWNEAGMSFFIDIHEKYGVGDAVELFLDTRDLKTKGIVSRFCHHFRFTLESGQEITRFRGGDIHRLADPEELMCKGEVGKRGYTLSIAIPEHCLHGYDPVNFPRVGFTYRIQRTEGEPMHFSVSSFEYNIEQHPATWGSLHLV